MKKSKSKFYILDTQTGRIRFTRSGIEHFGPRFQKAGINLRNIHTIDAFKQASRVVEELRFRQLALDIKGRDQKVDAIMTGLPGWG